MSPRLEDDVREALWVSTERLTTPPDAYARVMSTVADDRRRRRTVVAGSGIAAVLLAGVVGLSTGTFDGEPRTSTPATEQVIDRSPDWGPHSDWPVRGESATDSKFGVEFERLHGADHLLLYDEDGDAGRVVIALSAAREAVVFYGRPGAQVTELQRIPGLKVDTRDVAVAVPHEDGHLVIVVMPEYFHDAQVSIPSVARDGSAGRAWHQIPVKDGVARAVVQDPIGVVRVRTPAGDGPPHVIVGGEPAGTLHCGLCDSDWFAREGVNQFREQSAAVVGSVAESVSAHVLLDVAVDDSRAVALVATLPSGGLLRATYLVTTTDDSPTVSMVEPLRPLPAGDEARPIVLPPGTVTEAADEAWIIAPGATRISFTPLHDATPIADAVLTDGVGMVSTAPAELKDHRLTTYDSDGSAQKTWHGGALQSDDPLQVFDSRWTGRTG